MATISCPECGTILEEFGSLYKCTDCKLEYEISFTCQECGEVPEEISSCGSVGYFCRSCNSLRSRTSMNKTFVPVISDPGR